MILRLGIFHYKIITLGEIIRPNYFSFDSNYISLPENLLSKRNDKGMRWKSTILTAFNLNTFDSVDKM